MSTRRISEPKGFQLATAEAALETLTHKDGRVVFSSRMKSVLERP